MFSHNLKQIIRSLLRYKGFTFINLSGLSIGIAATIIIFLISNFENSFDSFHTDNRNIYRVVTKAKRANEDVFSANVPYPTGKFLRNEYAGGQVTQIHFGEDMNVRIGKQEPFEEKNIVFADSLFFNVLDFSGIHNFWIEGNQATAIMAPNKAILTQSTAKKYFGKINPMGKIIRINNLVDVEITGIIKDVPANSHLPMSMIVSYSTFNKDFLSGLDPNSWTFTSNGYTYVRLKDASALPAADNALKAIVHKNSGTDRYKREHWTLQPLSQIHFDPVYEDSNPVYTVSKKYLAMLLLLACFIILIACVNYINLSTSLAFSKSKEVGIRKTIGASKTQLFFHYMMETILVTTVAALIGLAISLLILPAINNILDKSISSTQLFNIKFIAGSIAGILIISFISGIYPSMILSGFSPITVLKNRFAMPGKSSTILRKGLVVFQFTTSIILIICTIVIAKQSRYFHNKELGFNKESVVEIGLPVTDSAKIESFRALIQNETGIQQLSFCLGAPISDNGFGTSVEAPELSKNIDYNITFIPSDKEYFKAYGMKLLAGREFLSGEEKTLGTGVVVNESLVKMLGYKTPAEVIGKKIRIGVNEYNPSIIGVTADFHTTSLHQKVGPVALMPFPYFYYAAAVRLNPGNIKNTLTKIESAWKKVYPESVYQFKFIDETLAKRYEQESKNYNLFKAFSMISIFICCIGLWGLIAFVVVHKTKEIGIRKVLGASVNGIVMLLSKDFLKLVLIALLVASPIAWYFMDKWLQDFAYRIDISWWVFAIAGLFAVMIALMTISFQTVRTAMANPVKNLRTE